MMKFNNRVFFPTMGIRILNKILSFFLPVIDIRMPMLIFTTHFVTAVVYLCFAWFRLRSQYIDKKSPSKIVLFTLTFTKFS